MEAISKKAFDEVFGNLPFWEAVDTCIEISKFNLECQLDDRIRFINFKDSLDNTGFITYDTPYNFVGYKIYFSK